MHSFARLLLLPAVPLMILMGGSAAAQTVSDLFDRLSASVAEVHVREWVAEGAVNTSVRMIPSQGSGVLISADGQMLTVAHLVQTADEIQVEFRGGELVRARVIASEPAADVALLQLDEVPLGMKPAPLSDSDAAAIGERILIVGAPYHLPSTLTVGYLGGRHRPASPYGQFSPLELFQTDAAMHQGTSGAPLFNMRGEVVGIATGVQTSGGRFEGLGFAVTSNTARELLLTRRSFWSGIGGYWLAGDLARALNIPQAAGLLVQRIARDSPAHGYSCRPDRRLLGSATRPSCWGGDIILAMQGISLAEEHGYQAARDALARLRPGDVLRVRVLRGGRQLDLSGTLIRGH